MYRVSPFTYFVEGILSTAVANTPVVCGTDELQRFQPPAGETCGSYMQAYQSFAGGYLVDESATSNCEFCQLSDTNVFLANFGIKYSNRWRDFGLIWVYIIVNVAAAIGLYWLARVVSVAAGLKGTMLMDSPRRAERRRERCPRTRTRSWRRRMTPTSRRRRESAVSKVITERMRKGTTLDGEVELAAIAASDLVATRWRGGGALWPCEMERRVECVAIFTAQPAVFVPYRRNRYDAIISSFASRVFVLPKVLLHTGIWRNVADLRSSTLHLVLPALLLLQHHIRPLLPDTPPVILAQVLLLGRFRRVDRLRQSGHLISQALAGQASKIFHLRGVSGWHRR